MSGIIRQTCYIIDFMTQIFFYLLYLMGNILLCDELQKCKVSKNDGNLHTLDEIKSKIRPFDLIFFKSGCLISSFEQLVSPNVTGDFFTHVGIIVTREILDIPELENGKLYIFESTLNGQSGFDVPDVDGKSCNGVQLRNLYSVIDAYKQLGDVVVAWGPLLNNPLDILDLEEVKLKFAEIHKSLIGSKYDANCYSLLSTIWPSLRPCRNFIEKLTCTSKWIFCSELVGIVLFEMGTLGISYNPKDLTPFEIASNIPGLLKTVQSIAIK